MRVIKMRDNPNLRHVPMAVGGEGMLVKSFIRQIFEFQCWENQTRKSSFSQRRTIWQDNSAFEQRCPVLSVDNCVQISSLCLVILKNIVSIVRKWCKTKCNEHYSFGKNDFIDFFIRKIISEYDENYGSCGLDEAFADLTDHLVKRIEMNEEKRTFPKDVNWTDFQSIFSLLKSRRSDRFERNDSFWFNGWRNSERNSSSNLFINSINSECRNRVKHAFSKIMFRWRFFFGSFDFAISIVFQILTNQTDSIN